jgi:hypothetical protein
MGRPKTEELQKHTLNLRTGDLEALATLFPRQPPSIIVRRIISKFVDQSTSVAEETPDVPDLSL